MAGWYRRYEWAPYVPVAKRRAQAQREVAALAKKGRKTEPVVIEGREIAQTFWGKGWCEHLEKFSDYSNRLPRGRTYARNGSVIDLKLSAGRLSALVSGSSIYTIKGTIAPLAGARWKRIKTACAGKIDSLVELLQGKLSGGIMKLMTSRDDGLFPSPKEIKLSCSCPDSAQLCKHLAAVLYGIGSRLDTRPELLFLLRGLDHMELLSAAAAGSVLGGTRRRVDETAPREEDLAGVFGIELDSADVGRADVGRVEMNRGAAPGTAEKDSRKTRPKEKAARKGTKPAGRIGVSRRRAPSTPRRPKK